MLLEEGERRRERESESTNLMKLKGHERLIIVTSALVDRNINYLEKEFYFYFIYFNRMQLFKKFYIRIECVCRGRERGGYNQI